MSTSTSAGVDDLPCFIYIIMFLHTMLAIVGPRFKFTVLYNRDATEIQVRYQNNHQKAASRYRESTPCWHCQRKNWDTKEDKGKSMMRVVPRLSKLIGP